MLVTEHRPDSGVMKLAIEKVVIPKHALQRESTSYQGRNGVSVIRGRQGENPSCVIGHEEFVNQTHCSLASHSGVPERGFGDHQRKFE